MYLIVMRNAHTTKNKIHQLFDLKGSEVGRTTPQKDRKPGNYSYYFLIKIGVPLKDLDFDTVITVASVSIKN